MNPHKPKLVIFDLAGTTVRDDKDVHRCLQAALRSADVEISIEEANEVMGIPKPIAIEMLLREHRHSDINHQLISKVHGDFVDKMIDFYKTDPNLAENGGVSSTFKRLKEHGIFVAVDTGFDRTITDALLERMGWIRNGLVDVSVTSDEVLHGRPAPDMILRAMELTGVNDSNLVAKVGDTASDILEGQAAECGWVIGITSGAYTRHDLLKHNPTHLIDQIPEILDVLGIF